MKMRFVLKQQAGALTRIPLFLILATGLATLTPLTLLFTGSLFQTETITLSNNSLHEQNKEGKNKTLLVQPEDYIYNNKSSEWDVSPIVIESHKLVFFTIPKVGCTVWKQLFRRMVGYKDWKAQEIETGLPHNPLFNGLKYLKHFPIKQASEMMTSPEWTRAMMVRDPKIRFLSAFLEKVIKGNGTLLKRKKTCCPDGSCLEGARTLSGFLDFCRVCPDTHWRPQQDRLDSKYFPYIDWIGHLETAQTDAKELLQHIGAWDEYGKSGWGSPQIDQAIFENIDTAAEGTKHATGSDRKLQLWYNPALEKKVEIYYSGDYENSLFHFSRNICITCKTPDEANEYNITKLVALSKLQKMGQQ